MRVLVVYGGWGLSDEAEISVQSGREVLRATRQLADVEAEELELTSDNLSELPKSLGAFDLVWPVLHGKFGEDGQFQRICEAAGVSYVGSSSQASAVCFDKPAYKKLLQAQGLPTPDYQVMRSVSEQLSLAFPVFVKPVDSGSGLGVARINSSIDWDHWTASRAALAPMLIEEFIAGTEITVAILGEAALPVLELIPPPGELFDITNKYNGATQEICPTFNIATELQIAAQVIAKQIHQLCNCRHFSRTDMIIRNNQIFVLETNTLPGMTRNSLFPKQAQAAGYDMVKLAEKIIKLALT